MSDATSISVAVRIRPFSIREAAQLSTVKDADRHIYFGSGSLSETPAKLTGKGIRNIVKPLDDQVLVFDPPDGNPLAKFQKTLMPAGRRVKDMRYAFDRVFDENATQEEVYMSTTKSLLDSILDGYNATVFAYGATGCGKTHTISGTLQHPGIIFLTMQELFEKVEAISPIKRTEISLSYLEIYNETIRDLLVPGGSTKGLALREDADQKISVPGLSTHHPKTVQEVMEMILLGNENRTMSPTEANAVSSRSHAILQVNLSQRDRTANISENHTTSTLSIIDLAGSERASATHNTGKRLEEGANINRSLLALGNCINALCDPIRKNHIPYRDSKLTRLLKFSLGGNCKTVMIVCVSPSSQHYDETHNTLKYANRAKNIKTKVSKNLISVDRHVSQYVRAIYDLRQEIEELKSRVDTATKDATAKALKLSNLKRVNIRDSLRKVRAVYEDTATLRQNQINDKLAFIRVSKKHDIIRTWVSAYDHILMESRIEWLLKSREKAELLLQELERKRSALLRKQEINEFERTFDKAVQAILRTMKLTEGMDEDNLQPVLAESDKFKSLASAEFSQREADFISQTDFTEHLLQNSFETARICQQLTFCEDEGKPALQQSLIDLLFRTLTSFIKPDDTFNLVTNTPRKASLSGQQKLYREVKDDPPSVIERKSPRRIGVRTTPTAVSRQISPLKSPRNFRARSPQKQVLFARNRSPNKKRVRWEDDSSLDSQKTETEVHNPRNQLMNPDFLATKQGEPLQHLTDGQVNNRQRDENLGNTSAMSVSFDDLSPSETTSVRSSKPSSMRRSAITKPTAASAARKISPPSSLEDRNRGRRVKNEKENSYACLSPRTHQRFTMSGLHSGSLRVANPAALIKEFSGRDDIERAESTRRESCAKGVRKAGWR